MSSEDSKTQILAAAIACIARDGIEGASMRSVAREAGVSLGLLSYHFTDKQSLIAATFELATDRLLDTSLDALDAIDDPIERVKAFVRGAFHGEFLEADYLALRTTLWAVSRVHSSIAAVEASLYLRYAEHLQKMIVSAFPTLTADEAASRATDVIVTQNGLWLNWARYRNPADLERGLRRCEALALGEL